MTQLIGRELSSVEKAREAVSKRERTPCFRVSLFGMSGESSFTLTSYSLRARASRTTEKIVPPPRETTS